jgi:hypothetical protein
MLLAARSGSPLGLQIHFDHPQHIRGATKAGPEVPDLPSNFPSCMKDWFTRNGYMAYRIQLAAI